MPAIGVGPRPIEHVLPVGVGLQIERHRAGELVASPQGEMTRCPACRGGCAARRLQAVQERVAQERAVADVPVPSARVDSGQAVEDANGGLQRDSASL